MHDVRFSGTYLQRYDDTVSEHDARDLLERRDTFPKSLRDMGDLVPRVLQHVKDYFRRVQDHGQRFPSYDGLEEFALEDEEPDVVKCFVNLNRVCELVLILEENGAFLRVFDANQPIFDEHVPRGTLVILPCVWNYSRGWYRSSHTHMKRSLPVLRSFVTKGRVPFKQRRYAIASLMPFRTPEKDIGHAEMIRAFDGDLSARQCISLIRMFLDSPEKIPGQTSSGLQTQVKKTTDVIIRDPEVVSLLMSRLKRAVDAYFASLSDVAFISQHHLTTNTHALKVPLFKIQYYRRGEGHYAKHFDDRFGVGRVLAFMWYLNNVTEGGETIFFNDSFAETRIRPTAGTLLLFPTNWTFTHGGATPLSDDKYIINGWIYSDYFCEHQNLMVLSHARTEQRTHTPCSRDH